MDLSRYQHLKVALDNALMRSRSHPNDITFIAIKALEFINAELSFTSPDSPAWKGFYNLFPDILKVLFGDHGSRSGGDGGGTSAGAGLPAGFRAGLHLALGFQAQQHQFHAPHLPHRGTQSGAGRSGPLPFDCTETGRRVLDLLGPPKESSGSSSSSSRSGGAPSDTLYSIIARRNPTCCYFPVSSLPCRSQAYVNSSPFADSLVMYNVERLYWLLQQIGLGQVEAVGVGGGGGGGRGGGGGGSAIAGGGGSGFGGDGSFERGPRGSGSGGIHGGAGGGKDNGASQAPHLVLTMLAFYHFVFADYAPRYPQPSIRTYRAGLQGLTRGNPYLVLVLTYARSLFPHMGAQQQQGTNGVSASGSGGRGSIGAVQNAELSAPMSELPEIVLRCWIEFWLCQEASCRFDRGGERDLVEEEVPYGNRPPSEVQLMSTLTLAAHLLADPRLKLLSEQARQRPGEVALTPPLAVMQPFLFDFLCLSFKSFGGSELSQQGGAGGSGDVAAAGLGTAGLLVDLWLLWLQPWGAPGYASGKSLEQAARAVPGSSSSSSSSYHLGSRGGGDGGHSTSGAGVGHTAGGGGGRGGGGGGGGVGSAATRSGYTSEWEGWVLQNYHLYSTLLVVFVCSVGKLPSARDSVGSSGGSSGGGGLGSSGSGGGGGAGSRTSSSRGGGSNFSSGRSGFSTAGAGASSSAVSPIGLLKRVIDAFASLGPEVQAVLQRGAVADSGYVGGGAIELTLSGRGSSRSRGGGGAGSSSNGGGGAGGGGGEGAAAAGGGGGDHVCGTGAAGKVSLRMHRLTMLQHCGGGMRGLEHYQDKARDLLERIASQTAERDRGGSKTGVWAKLSRVVSDFFAPLLSPFGESVLGKGETREQHLVHNVKRIFGIDEQWQPQAYRSEEEAEALSSPSSPRRSGGGGSGGAGGGMRPSSPLEAASSSCGSGIGGGNMRKGRVDEVRFIGDGMRRPVDGREIGWLVRLLVRLSDEGNERLLGIAPPHLGQAAEPGGDAAHSRYGSGRGDDGGGDGDSDRRRHGSGLRHRMGVHRVALGSYGTAPGGLRDDLSEDRGRAALLRGAEWEHNAARGLEGTRLLSWAEQPPVTSHVGWLVLASWLLVTAPWVFVSCVGLFAVRACAAGGWQGICSWATGLKDSLLDAQHGLVLAVGVGATLLLPRYYVVAVGLTALFCQFDLCPALARGLPVRLNLRPLATRGTLFWMVVGVGLLSVTPAWVVVYGMLSPLAAIRAIAWLSAS